MKYRIVKVLKFDAHNNILRGRYVIEKRVRFLFWCWWITNWHKQPDAYTFKYLSDAKDKLKELNSKYGK